MASKTQSKIKTEWDLTLFYKSLEDPQIEKDVKNTDKLFTAFEKKYKNNDSYLKDENALLKVLTEYEKLSSLPLFKPGTYLGYLQTLNTTDEKVRAKQSILSQRYSKISNKLVFFDVKLSKIDQKNQKKFLNSKKLLHFKYFLEKIFESSKYILTEPEEKILSLKSLTSRGMWSDLTKKLLGKISVTHDGKEVPVDTAMDIALHLPTQKERSELIKKCEEKIEKIVDVATGEMNAIITDKKINDELRGYKEAYDATILGYENDKKSVLNLIKVVTENFRVSQRFFKLKAKMLGVSKLNYVDRGADAGEQSKKLSFNESLDILKRVFSSLDPEFGKILENMVAGGQIDVYPKVGKRGGAFCSSSTNQPTMVMLNHKDDLKSHSTFAHEMGHAIHSEFSKKQSALYDGYSTSTAETASTLFETFVFYDALEKMSKEEKMIALHDKISDDIATIFRQIACFNFELDMHNTVRAKGTLSSEQYMEMMNKHMKAYLGDAFDLKPKDGLFFVTWPHLRYNFYVYSYAFGQLTSKALYKKYSEDKSYIEKVKKFLSLGGSMSPEDIFKSIGIDVLKPDFFKKGIESIEDDISQLEKLVNKR